MRSGEESDQTVRVRRPDAEGELEGLVIHLNVVVADQDGVGPDGGGSRVEASVEADRWLTEEGDWCRAEGRGGEVVGQLGHHVRWGVGVSPEDEHGGYQRRRGVRGRD